MTDLLKHPTLRGHLIGLATARARLNTLNTQAKKLTCTRTEDGHSAEKPCWHGEGCGSGFDFHYRYAGGGWGHERFRPEEDTETWCANCTEWLRIYPERKAAREPVARHKRAIEAIARSLARSNHAR